MELLGAAAGRQEMVGNDHVEQQVYLCCHNTIIIQDGYIALVLAAATGNTALVNHLQAAGVDINLQPTVSVLMYS